MRGFPLIVLPIQFRFAVAAIGFLYVCLTGSSQIVINEIHYDPESPTSLTEYVELYNNSNQDVDLTGWNFSSGLTYVFPESTVLPAKSYYVITESKLHYSSVFKKDPDGEFTAGQLANEGERIALKDSTGNLIDEVKYKPEFPWPVPAAGGGASMELMNPNLDNDLGGSWRASLSSTPGDLNSAFRTNSPPQVRQVRHYPQQPKDFQNTLIQAKVSDPDLVGTVRLYYQVVAPGH